MSAATSPSRHVVRVIGLRTDALLTRAALEVLVTLTRLARPNGLVSLGVVGRDDHARDLRSPAFLAAVDELLALDFARLAGANVLRSQGELVLDVSQWLSRLP